MWETLGNFNELYDFPIPEFMIQRNEEIDVVEGQRRWGFTDITNHSKIRWYNQTNWVINAKLMNSGLTMLSHVKPT